MEALLKGIKAAFAASSPAVEAITGGLFLNIVPPGTAMPYAIARVVSASASQTYGTEYFSEPHVDFIVRSSTADAALQNAETLLAAFLNHTLVITPGQFLNSNLVMEPIEEPGNPVKDEQENLTWGYIFTFRFTTQT